MLSLKQIALPLVGVAVLIGVGAGMFYFAKTAQAPVDAPLDGGTSVLTLALGEEGTVGGVRLKPLEVVEDSRCAEDVTCIQAGTIRVRVELESGLGRAEQVFMIGEPITTEAERVTLLSVSPAPISTKSIADDEYRFTFRIDARGLKYENASADDIKVEIPFPDAVTGKSFAVIGQARGPWFFEASFPIVLLDSEGNELAVAVAQAEGEWMTEEFVPFRADITVPESYTGPAALLLKKDNPSGLPEHDASVSFPITVEY